MNCQGSWPHHRRRIVSASGMRHPSTPLQIEFARSRDVRPYLSSSAIPCACHDKTPEPAFAQAAHRIAISASHCLRSSGPAYSVTVESNYRKMCSSMLHPNKQPRSIISSSRYSNRYRIRRPATHGLGPVSTPRRHRTVHRQRLQSRKALRYRRA